MREIKKYIEENINDCFIEQLIYGFIDFEEENTKIENITQKSIRIYYSIYKCKMGFLPLSDEDFIKLFKNICKQCYLNYENLTIKEIKKDLKKQGEK